MKVKTTIKKQFELTDDECKRVRVHTNTLENNSVFLPEREFPGTSKEDDESVLTITSMTDKRRMYRLTCKVSYTHYGNAPVIPFQIGIAVHCKEDEDIARELEEMVKNSTKLIIELEQRRDGVRQY